MSKFKPWKNRSKSFCVHPWSHLAIEPNGNVIPCCHARWKNPNVKEENPTVLGNINSQSTEEIFNGKKMRDIRLSMLTGTLPENICGKCIMYEKNKTKSPRHWAFNKPYANEITYAAAETKKDGTFENYKIKYWDLRYSNVCNMSCIMCSPTYSHKWTAEIKNIDKNLISEDARKQVAGVLVYDRDEVLAMPKKLQVKNLNWVDEGINDVEDIYFAGGEPLVMDEHWYILKKLDEMKRYDVQIKYNTNMLKLDYKGENVIDYWKKWKTNKLLIECSIDETEQRAEYIRYGTDWEIVKTNIRKVIDAGIRIKPIISVACYNIHRLEDLYYELQELFKGSADGNFDPTLNPVFTKAYSFAVWPDEYKSKFKKQLKNLDKSLMPGVKNRLKTLVKMLESDHDRTCAINFLRKSAVLDVNRNNSIFESIPEMKVINELYDNEYEKTQDLYKKHIKEN